MRKRVFLSPSPTFHVDPVPLISSEEDMPVPSPSKEAGVHSIPAPTVSLLHSPLHVRWQGSTSTSPSARKEEVILLRWEGIQIASASSCPLLVKCRCHRASTSPGLGKGKGHGGKMGAGWGQGRRQSYWCECCNIPVGASSMLLFGAALSGTSVY